MNIIKKSINRSIKRIAKISFFYLFLILYSCNFSTSEIHKNTTEFKESEYRSIIESIIYPFVDSGFVGAVLVADSNGVILNKAYGKSKTPFDSNTRFWIASNTKPITAVAVMKLVEEGKLSVKDSLPQFFKNVPLDKIHITVEQLLTHSSGLPSDFIAEGEQNKEIAVKKILSQKLISEPGMKENYSNDGYDLLGAIVEVSSKKKYKTYLREAVFEKVGMKNSNFSGENEIVVDPYHDSIIYQPFYSKAFINGKPLENPALIGSGGISSNTVDLYKLMIALKSEQILNKKSLAELFKPRIDIEKKGDTILSWAYGWVVQTIREKIEIRHSGRSDWAHNSRLFFLNNGFIVILWARDNGPINKAWASEISYPLIKEINKLK